MHIFNFSVTLNFLLDYTQHLMQTGIDGPEKMFILCCDIFMY